MDFLKLFPVTLSPMDRQTGKEAMAELLQNETFENIVKQRVDSIYSWKDETLPVLRRIHRNISRAYTREELEWATDHDLRRFLPKEASHA